MRDIPKSEFRTRLNATRRIMRERGLDVLLTFSCFPEREANVTYFTGYHSGFPVTANDTGRIGLGYCAVLITEQSDPVLFVPVEPAGELDTISAYHLGFNLPANISSHIKKERVKGKKVGIAGMDILPVFLYQELQRSLRGLVLEPADDIVRDLRKVKSENEIRVMQRAAKVVDEGFEAAVKSTSEGVTEQEIASKVIETCLSLGADWIARTRMYSGVVSTPLGRWPFVTSRKVRAGEIVGMDLIGWYHQYSFDTQRYWICGSPGKKERELLENAAELTELAISHARGGVDGQKIASAVMERARELKLEQQYVTMWGHGIGLEIVERPFLVPESREALDRGSVVSIEPRLSIPKVGHAIFEDMVVIRENSADVLTKFPRTNF